MRGKLVTRGQAKRADYILYYKPNIPLALIEAKDNSPVSATEYSRASNTRRRSTSPSYSLRTAMASSSTTTPGRAARPRQCSLSMPFRRRPICGRAIGLGRV